MSMIEGMVFGALVLLALAGLRRCVRSRAAARKARRRSAQLERELAEFAEHPAFRWADREQR